VIQGATLGDLREDNLRSIMFQAEVSPLEDTPVQPVIECELSYSRDIDGVPKKFVAKRAISLNYTRDFDLLKTGINKEVKIQTNIRKISEIDKALADAMCSDDKQAEKLLLEEISILEEVLEIDETEFGGSHKIAQLLLQSKKNLEDLRQNGVTKQQIKEVHHRGYTASRG